MRKTSRRSLMLIAIIAVISLIAGVTLASAQIPVVQCPGGCYTVDLTQFPDGHCYPIPITTTWADGTLWPPLPGWPGYPGPGIFTECPRVPPGTPLSSIDVCGTLLPPVTGYYTVVCGNGCVLCVVVCLDDRGCLYVKVYQGPCTVDIAMPCP